MSENNLEYWINKFEETSFYKTNYNRIDLKKSDNDSFITYEFLLNPSSVGFQFFVKPENLSCISTWMTINQKDVEGDFPLTEEGLNDAIREIYDRLKLKI